MLLPIQVTADVRAKGKVATVLLTFDRRGFGTFRTNRGVVPHFPGREIEGSLMVCAIGHSEVELLAAAFHEAATKLRQAIFASGAASEGGAR